jgi:hypothetical protein
LPHFSSSGSFVIGGSMLVLLLVAIVLIMLNSLTRTRDTQ